MHQLNHGRVSLKNALCATQLKAVILDLAGTCVDYGSCAPAGAFVELFQGRSVAVSIAKARVPMGLHKRDHIRAILSMPDVADQWRKALGRDWGEADLDTLYADFIPLQLAILPRYSRLIPGVAEALAALKAGGLRIGVTTGYNRQMMEVVLAEAAGQGFVPEAAVCAEDVPAGRPAPWMVFRCMEALDAWPPAAVVTAGDTLPDIFSGIHAGVWSVGVAGTGNMLGLSQEDMAALKKSVLAAGLKKARQEVRSAGAHFVVDGVAEIGSVVERINRRLAMGKKP
jgi:phosphonoacetaldehyde hydrolase